MPEMRKRSGLLTLIPTISIFFTYRRILNTEMHREIVTEEVNPCQPVLPEMKCGQCQELPAINLSEQTLVISEWSRGLKCCIYSILCWRKFSAFSWHCDDSTIISFTESIGDTNCKRPPGFLMQVQRILINIFMNFLVLKKEQMLSRSLIILNWAGHTDLPMQLLINAFPRREWRSIAFH